MMQTPGGLLARISGSQSVAQLRLDAKRNQGLIRVNTIGESRWVMIGG